MTAAPDAGTGRRAAQTGLVAVATALTLLGIAIALFFNPVWVAFEQERTQADYWTGWPMATVHSATNAVLGEVYFGPGMFLQEVNGQRIFTPNESAHMHDVRGVVIGFFLLCIAGAIVFVAGAIRARGARWWWRAVARGAGLLAVGAVVLGIAFALFFDQAFTIFHRIFFPQGNWAFAADSTLLRMFPDAFWTETSVAIAIAGVVMTTGLWAFARRKAATKHAAGW